MLMTTIQIAAETPGLPLGLSDIPSGWRRKIVQTFLIILFPFTILVLRLQHQMILRKRERVQELQNAYLIDEFNRLNALLMEMEQCRMKAIKLDIAFEVVHQIFLNLLLVLFSTSETRTETAMEALFNQEGVDDFLGMSNFTIFVGSTIISFLSFINLFATAHANYWNWKSKMAVGVYGILNLATRLLAMLLYFVPSLGMLNILRHYQAERIPFANLNLKTKRRKYDFSNDMLYFGDAEPVRWADITHVNYSNPFDPVPPPYTIYTGLTSRDFFIIFGSMWLLQIFAIWLHNFLRSKSFKTLSGFDQIMHAFCSIITPAPSVDWMQGQGDCKEHHDRMKGIKKEVTGMVKINWIFNFLHILPLVYLGKH